VRLLVVTDRSACDDLPVTVAAAVRGGAPAVLFREKDLPRDERRALGEHVAEAAAGADLVVASDPELARHLGAVAVHLASADPWPEPAAPASPERRLCRRSEGGVADDLWPVDGDLAVGRSCHDAAELRDAAAQGATYATLSPIFPTASKPGHGPALGPSALADSPLPVLALGGVEPGNAAACLAAGAAGVAVMGGVMAADDPEGAVRALLDALDAGAAA
jgi:thiamine-phosphate pyrophosphorylase